MNSALTKLDSRPQSSPGPTLIATKRPRRKRDRLGKQRALLDAALHLFAAKGFEATSTREIAAAAGCAEGLIHRYFHGKAGLLPALVEHHIREEMADLGRTLRPAPTLPAEFMQLVEWEVELMWKNREYLRVFIPRSMVDPAVRSSLSHAVLGIRSATVMERLKRYPETTQLARKQVEALAESVSFLGLIFGFMRPVVLGQDRLFAKQMATSIAETMIRNMTGVTKFELRE